MTKEEQEELDAWKATHSKHRWEPCTIPEVLASVPPAKAHPFHMTAQGRVSLTWVCTKCGRIAEHTGNSANGYADWVYKECGPRKTNDKARV